MANIRAEKSHFAGEPSRMMMNGPKWTFFDTIDIETASRGDSFFAFPFIRERFFREKLLWKISLKGFLCSGSFTIH
jgi:hypothetical protein